MDAKRQSLLLLVLPVDVLFMIMEDIELSDILMMRQTCHLLYELSQERPIWIAQLLRQQNYLPHPPELSGKLQDLPTSTLEFIVRRGCRVERLWPRIRSSQLVKLNRSGCSASTLLGIQMFLDRWLLVVYVDGIIQLYDIQSTANEQSHDPTTFYAHLDLNRSLWASYSAALDPEGLAIVVALTRSVPPYWLRVYEISLARSPDTDATSNEFHLLREYTLNSPKIVRAINTTFRVVAISVTSVVELLRWDEDALDNKFLILAHPEDSEDLWNGITAVRFMGPYILIAKTRSIELHHYMPMLQASSTKLPNLKHYFGHTTFRDVSFTNCQPMIHFEFSQGFQIMMLAYDVIQGLFMFKLELTIPLLVPNNLSRNDTQTTFSSEHPTLEVKLTGLYPLTMPHTLTSALPYTVPYRPDHLSNLSTTIGRRLHQGQDSPTPTFSHNHFIQGHLVGHGSAEVGARGFLSAHCIGPQGRRAIWIERKRASTVREVQVWGYKPVTTEIPPALHSLSHLGPDCVEFERKVIHLITSYDLRDDVTHCTFGESTGVIVLGNRSGEVSILPLE